ncbi:hypothetical protein ABE28_011135 [Peribacillus muralis]|uniref:Uncharacterized protein n=1 Tax=Peribacillus muralis TaxID=264697 RepID=A0A1B3XNW0_9BACI|nr:hypothetical protein [Peribacillus muralis]AOH54906.1 hypothetical protein ABE28_011135 [Peribacillus muralis]
MNLQTNQLSIKLKIKNRRNFNLQSHLHEMCDYSKEYEHDIVEVQEVQEVKRINGGNYEIIISVTRDLDCLGEPLDRY